MRRRLAATRFSDPLSPPPRGSRHLDGTWARHGAS